MADSNGHELSLSSNETLRTSFFNQLKPYTLGLLDLLQNPNKNPSFLSEFADFLRRAPAAALQPCFDYALFPLLLVLDASIDCRSKQNSSSKGNFDTYSSPPLPYPVSDRVAEGVLQCLEEVLKKCHLGSVDQMLAVMKKLISGALLSPSEAAEEFREGIIRCLRALLFRLDRCSVESCMCKWIHGLPALLSGTNIQTLHITPLQFRSELNECLLAFLRSQDASPMVGQCLSLLLQIADNEAARGHHGSGKLRTEAFITLRLFVAKVGTADALAFFLPGVVSGFAKVLHVSKTMISGAAGSMESIDNAIRGLSEFLMIAFGDEENLYGLDMSVDDNTGSPPNKSKSTQEVLEALRHLPISAEDQVAISPGNLLCQPSTSSIHESELREKRTNSCHGMGPLCVKRTSDWIEETSLRVDKLLSATFPHLCIHPAKRVRHGLVDSIRGLLSKCMYTLKRSKLMLLECLCTLVCDDSEDTSFSAKEFLESLFMLDAKHLAEDEVAEIFSRLVEKLPRLVLGSDETIAVSHAQRLLAVVYYAGPQLVVDHLLRSPITATRFMDALALSLSHKSVFAGSVDKLILAKPNSAAYLHSIVELKSGGDNHRLVDSIPSDVSGISGFHDPGIQNHLEMVREYYELPRMPPWFVHVGSQKLYRALAGILRLVGLSTVADGRREVSLSVLTDFPLEYFRKLISELRMKEYSKESWHSWYARSGSGQTLRQASTAACILNEIIYGMSEQSVDLYAKMFQKSKTKADEIYGKESGCAGELENSILDGSVWKVCLGKDNKSHLINCVGSILHEYLCPEVWNLPIAKESSLLAKDAEEDDMPSYFYRDTTMLHQVIIEGIGIFSISLGKDFLCSGFLHASLYLLLENLICSSYQIRSVSDAVLHVLAAACGHRTVGHLVVANADYIIDSLCRQLRHLDLNPHVPNVLAAMLSYIGVAHQILPLLEEPMRAVSLELEVLGRHQHPDLTIPFLKAVREIVKASRNEACAMPNEAESFSLRVKSEVVEMTEWSRKNVKKSVIPRDSTSEMSSLASEHWEEMLFKLNESRRYRRTVGSIVGSCLTAATPLLASVNDAASLVALDIVEEGIATLAKVEEAYRHEKESKEAIGRAIEMCSFHDLQDAVDTTDEGADENRLLPAMNKIWPYLIHCLKYKILVATMRCLSVVSSVVQICGGDFFSRRFHTDGAHFWKLLTTSPFQSRPISKGGPILLPYRSTSTSSSEGSMAEVSCMKVQAAALHMIADISRNKRSASAFEVVLKKVSGLVVGIACSSVAGLHDASINALSGLACVDPDLIWLLLADVYYSLKKGIPSPPSADFAEVTQLLPPPSSSKDYLYVQYGGESFGFDVDLSSAEVVFRKLQSKSVF